MPDIVDPATRSRMMAGIRSRSTGPELLLRRTLHARGLRYRVHNRTLPGTPDLVFRRFQAVCFVHGCFWHRHAGCRYATTPRRARTSGNPNLQKTWRETNEHGVTCSRPDGEWQSSGSARYATEGRWKQPRGGGLAARERARVRDDSSFLKVFATWHTVLIGPCGLGLGSDREAPAGHGCLQTPLGYKQEQEPGQLPVMPRARGRRRLARAPRRLVPYWNSGRGDGSARTATAKTLSSNIRWVIGETVACT